MIKRKITLLLIFLLFTVPSFSQKNDSARISLNHYSLTVGFGWSHYINSLELGKDEAAINFPGVSLKFFWEPEHRLSLGLESGFYCLYRVKHENDPEAEGRVTMSVVPLLLTVRMRIVDHFYLTAGAGLAAMFNKVSGVGQTINSTVWSLSNYQFSGSYLYPLNKHWIVGGELKVFNFGKADDWMYSLQACCAIRL